MGRVSAFIDAVRDGYGAIVARLVRLSALSLVLLGVIAFGIYGIGSRTPTGFLPQEDQGAFFVEMQLPDGASLNRTRELSQQVEGIIQALPGIQAVQTVTGYSMLNGLAQANSAFFILTLKSFEERTAPEAKVTALIAAVARGVAKAAETARASATDSAETLATALEDLITARVDKMSKKVSGAA